MTVSPVIAISSSSTIDFGTVTDSTLGMNSLTARNTLRHESNMAIDVYTWANDTKMVNTNPSITDFILPIQFTPNDGSPTDYGTEYQIAYSNWLKPKQGSSEPVTWDEVLDINVPSYTNNGTYTVTIYNTAVAHGAAAPTTS